jgi:mono/diheme cytochrome c family protein
MIRTCSAAIAGVLLTGLVVAETPQAAPQANVSPVASPHASHQALLNRYCITCHNQRARTAGLTLDTHSLQQIDRNADVWEKVVRKLRTGMMPPAGMPHPQPADVTALVSWLEAELDRAARDRPDPGRSAVHRLNRAEYKNAIRDLVALDLDVETLLPPDDSALGFDNIAEVLSISPALLDRYMSAARQVSQLALGTAGPRIAVYRAPKDLVQDERISDDLPLGSRGGIAVRHYFPADGDYLIRIRLQRNVMDEIRGLADVHQVDLRVDGRRIKLFAVGGEVPEAGKEGVAPVHTAISTYLINADDHLEVTLPLEAGTHDVAATVVGRRSKPEGPFQPPITPKSADFFTGRHTGFGIGLIEIRGPDAVTAPGNTPSRRQIFVCTPSPSLSETACAKQILSTIARRAFRRPVTEQESSELLASFAIGQRNGGFESGVGLALRRILVSPHFLFRVERDPDGVKPGAPYRLGDLDLASRLSFFLWSSVPDDQLLDVAARGRLSDPAVLEQQVRRMLADPRSAALIDNFVGQWLEVRNLPIAEPNQDVFADFDENLRRAFIRETELFLESILREDRSVLDVLTADYTFVNERLARFYGIPNIYGTRFRRVTWDASQRARAGVLGHGSVLTVTSYATRTSPVLRGKWILSNLLGVPPPPPPPDIPALVEKGSDGKALSMREAMAAHRKNPACASCHAVMDPLGLALENFDAIGRWRANGESAAPIDASGTLSDGTRFEGPDGLRSVLMARKQEFVGTLADKLLTYATGRGLEYSDLPAVRKVVREAATTDYRWSSIVLGVVRSTPFQMRRAGDRLESSRALQ